MSQKDSEAPRFSHIGMCVTDLEKSLRFYCGVLGFSVAESYDVGDEVAKTMELDTVKLRSQFIRRDDGISLELLYYDSPACFGSRDRRAMNQYGLTHLSFYVEDIQEVAAKVRDCGGQLHERTFTSIETMDLVFCTDPDGVRIELMQAKIS